MTYISCLCDFALHLEGNLIDECHTWDQCYRKPIFAGSDRFLVCKTDSVCIKRIFFGPKKTNTLCGSYTGPITWISQVSNGLLSIIIPIINIVNTLELLNREK